MKHWFIIGFFGLVALIACTEKKNVIGLWTIENMVISGDTFSGIDLDNPVYNFYEDGSYDIVIDAYIEKGTWSLDGDVFILTKEDGDEAVLKLTEVNDTHLKYETGEGDFKSEVILKK